MYFLEKTEFTEADIQEFIKDEVEESLYLEYKESGAIDKTDSKKKEIAKDVSAFANTDGGIIVYGIKEQNHKPSELSFINGNEFTKEWIENVIQSNIQRAVNGLLIIPVRFGNQLDKTVYVVKIPSSKNAPHMVVGKGFYKRSNFQSLPMEQYEIRESYNRKEKTLLSIEDIIVIGSGSSQRNMKIQSAGFKVSFYIKNLSNSIETQSKLEIIMPSVIYPKMDGVYRNKFEEYFVKEVDGMSIFSVSPKTLIFQGETAKVEDVKVHITKPGFFTLSKEKIKLKLYYTNGIAERKFNLTEYLKINNKLLAFEDFIDPY